MELRVPNCLVNADSRFTGAEMTVIGEPKVGLTGPGDENLSTFERVIARPWEDNAGLAAFCQALYPKLRSALLLQTNDHALAEDLAQETLCRIIERWDTVAVMDSPEGWAFTVAFNLARSWWRRLATGRRAVARLTEDAPTSSDPDHSIGPWVRDAIAQLPPRQRQVIVLRFFADLDVNETAEVMGCAPGTVKSLSSKARRALSMILEPEQAPSSPASSVAAPAVSGQPEGVL